MAQPVSQPGHGHTYNDRCDDIDCRHAGPALLEHAHVLHRKVEKVVPPPQSPTASSRSSEPSLQQPVKTPMRKDPRMFTPKVATLPEKLWAAQRRVMP